MCVFAGVVDSEDIPLNLSRELLQESVLIRCSATNLFFLSVISVIHFFCFYLFFFFNLSDLKVCVSFRKLRDVLQQRVIRFLLDQSKKGPEKYSKFFEDYGLFIREGIVTTQEQDVKVNSLLKL